MLDPFLHCSLYTLYLTYKPCLPKFHSRKDINPPKAMTVKYSVELRDPIIEGKGNLSNQRTYPKRKQKEEKFCRIIIK